MNVKVPAGGLTLVTVGTRVSRETGASAVAHYSRSTEAVDTGADCKQCKQNYSGSEVPENSVHLSQLEMTLPELQVGLYRPGAQSSQAVPAKPSWTHTHTIKNNDKQDVTSWVNFKRAVVLACRETDL